MSCDGTYADIERVEEDVMDQVEEMNALQLLVKEYEEYKKRYTESLMFNATASLTNYGGFWTERKYFTCHSFLSN